MKNPKTTWGSHVPSNIAAIKSYQVTGIMEIGAGFFSTPVFFENCKKVVSIETDLDWVMKMKESIKEDETHEIIHYNIPTEINRSTRRSNVSKEFLDESEEFWKKYISPEMNMLFIDCVSSLRRRASDSLYQYFDIVVVHDINENGMNNHWGRDYKPYEAFNAFKDMTYEPQYTGIMIKKELDPSSFIENHKKEIQKYTHGIESKLQKW